MKRVDDIPTRKEFLQRAGWLICGLSLAGASTGIGCSKSSTASTTSSTAQGPDPEPEPEPEPAPLKTVDGIELISTDEALSLLWFTDIHGAATELGTIAQFHSDNAEFVSDALCTGDTLSVSSEDDFGYWTQAGAAGTLICMGNHDRTSAKSAYDSKLTAEDAYARYLAPFAPQWTDRATMVADRTFYSVDYPAHNVKLLITDCNIQKGEALDEELAWFCHELAFAAAQGSAVIAASHFPPADGDPVTCDFTVGGAQSSTSEDHVANPSLVAAVDYFIEYGGTFIAWLCGHRHLDMVEVLEDHPGQLVIIQSCAIQSRERGDLVRNEGDASASCFTYTVFDTNNHTIALNRFGARTTTHGASRTRLVLNYLDKTIVSA